MTLFEVGNEISEGEDRADHGPAGEAVRMKVRSETRAL
jgi:hypothetical protein